MAMIFERTPQTIGGAFTAEDCRLSLGTTDSNGALVQRVNFTISRPINLVYELGDAKKNTGQNVYYVGGRRQGQATFERIVGGSDVFNDFLNNFGPLCEKTGDNIVLEAKGGCKIKDGVNLGNGVVYTLITPKITSVGASVSAQDIVIMESVSMIFLDLDVTPKVGAAPAAAAP